MHVCACVRVLQGAQQTRHKGERMQEEKIALYICVRVRVCASVCASVCSCGFSLLWLTTKIPHCSGLTDMAFSFSLLAFFPSFSSAPLYSNSKLSVGPEVCSRLILLTSFSTPLLKNGTPFLCRLSQDLSLTLLWLLSYLYSVLEL